jgi:3-oxoacyl-[acyl-carrier protein] reductase
MSFPIDLSGKVVLVTGASQGIGARMVRLFHEAGATVIINHADFEKAKEDAEALRAELHALRAHSALTICADVSKATAVDEMMHRVRQQFGGFDFLINNAAIIHDRSVAKMSLVDWQSVLDVDLTGVFFCCKYGLEVMRDGGAIVNMGSISAILGFFGQANYAAAKGGVLAMTRVLSRETARRGIRVNAIAPGVIKTTMADTIPENVRAEMLKDIPLNRFGDADEVAKVALFLCSPLASYVTGQTIEVNGGWHG